MLAIKPPEIQVGLYMDKVKEEEVKHQAIRKEFKEQLTLYVKKIVGDFEFHAGDWKPGNLPTNWPEADRLCAARLFKDFYSLYHSQGSLEVAIDETSNDPPICRMTPNGWIKEWTFKLERRIGGDFTCDGAVDLFLSKVDPKTVPTETIGPLRNIGLYAVVHFCIPFGEIGLRFL